MAVVPVDSAVSGNNTTTSFSITFPATQAGDVAVLEFTHRGTADGTIAGTFAETWTKKHERLYASSAFGGQTYTATCTGNHSGETVSVSGLTNSCAGILTIYRGADTADPLGAATIVGEENASGNETQAQITTTENGAFVVLVVANSPDVAVTSPACTSPGALTIRAEKLNAGGTDTSIVHASAEKATAGATGAFTWAQTNGASGSWAYAIKPAGATIVEADGAAAGAAAGTSVAAAIANGVTAAAGVAASAVVGAALWLSVATAPGAATGGAASATVLEAVGASSAVAGSSVVGQLVLPTDGTSAGIAAASAEGTDGSSGGDAVASGAATASGIGAATVQSAAAATGAAAGAGAATQLTSSIAASTGTAAAASASGSVLAAVGSGSGVAAASAAASNVVAASGACAAGATVLGEIQDANNIKSADAHAAGTCVVRGIQDIPPGPTARYEVFWRGGRRTIIARLG